MNTAEKNARIEYLLQKFYDVNIHPSNLLRRELRNTEPDTYTLNMISRLETLESERYKLENEYNDTIAHEMRPLKRIFEYEHDKLIKKHEQENLVPLFDPIRKSTRADTERRHSQELDALKRRHQDIKQRIEDTAKTKLDVCDIQIRSVFLDTLKHIYR